MSVTQEKCGTFYNLAAYRCIQVCVCVCVCVFVFVLFHTQWLKSVEF
jgi:hypothetical protein